MKKLFLLLLVLTATLSTFAQSVYIIEGDTIKMRKRVSGNTVVDIIGRSQATGSFKPGADTSYKYGLVVINNKLLIGNGSFFKQVGPDTSTTARNADTLGHTWYDDGANNLVALGARGVFTNNWYITKNGSFQSFVNTFFQTPLWNISPSGDFSGNAATVTNGIYKSDSLTKYVTPKNLRDTSTVLRGLANTNATNIATNATNITNEIARATAAELLKLNISDSLTKYVTPKNLRDTSTVLRGLATTNATNIATNTTNIANEITRATAAEALKLNIADTLNMLNNRISSITLNNTGILHTTPLTFTRAGGAWSATQTLATQLPYSFFSTLASSSAPSFRRVIGLNKDSTAITTGKIWGMVLDTTDNILKRQLLTIATPTLQSVANIGNSYTGQIVANSFLSKRVPYKSYGYSITEPGDTTIFQIQSTKPYQNNLIVGLNADTAITTGNGNTIFGRNAAKMNRGGNELVVIGDRAAETFVSDQQGAFAAENGIGVIIGSQAANLWQYGVSNVAIGQKACLGCIFMGQSTAIGAHNSLAADSIVQTVSIGQGNMDNALGSGIKSYSNIAVGDNISQGAGRKSDNVLIGHFTATNTTNIANDIFIGSSAANTFSGNNTIAIGTGAANNAISSNSIYLGSYSGVSDSLNNQFVIGSQNVPILNWYSGKGRTNANPQTYYINATGGEGANIAGGNLGLAGGFGTGNASGGAIVMNFATKPNTSSSILQASNERISFSSNNKIDTITASVSIDFKNSTQAITSAGNITSQVSAFGNTGSYSSDMIFNTRAAGALVERMRLNASGISTPLITATTVTATTFTDGVASYTGAQINRSSGFIEMQYPGAAGVRFFGNASSPVTFGNTGTITFPRTTTGTPGTDSLAVKTSTGLIRAISPTFYARLAGTTTNDAAIAGNIGENVESEINTATNYTTTATYQPVTSITLTAGDWDLSAIGTFNTNTATITAAANAIFVVSTTTASATGATAKNTMFIPQAALLGTSAQSSSSANYRVSIASTTTFFFNTQATFTLGNPQFTGFIRARRMR